MANELNALAEHVSVHPGLIVRCKRCGGTELYRRVGDNEIVVFHECSIKNDLLKTLRAARAFIQDELEVLERSYLPAPSAKEEDELTDARILLSRIDRGLVKGQQLGSEYLQRRVEIDAELARERAVNKELVEALEAAREELRLIRMKDCDRVYDSTLRMKMDLALSRARGAHKTEEVAR
jgi:hypothetical protein